MRIAADGFVHVGDGDPVRTPGAHDPDLDPLPEGEALSYFLSHAFPGVRRVVRSLSVQDRIALHHALWIDSVTDRMAIVDRIWRGITRPAAFRPSGDPPHLVQVVTYEGGWAYPLYATESGTTRVLPLGGLPTDRLDPAAREAPRIALGGDGAKERGRRPSA